MERTLYINRHFNPSSLFRLTWKPIFIFVLYAGVCVSLYRHMRWTWMHLPWLPISIIGTAVAFYVGFKNNSAYGRVWEARKIWGGIINSSRSWGIFVRDFIRPHGGAEVADEDGLEGIHRELIFRHIAWTYQHRRQLLQLKSWEHDLEANQTIREFLDKSFSPKGPKEELEDFLTKEEMEWVLAKKNPATQLISRQSQRLRELFEQGLVDTFRHIELQKLLMEFYTLQGKNERIKNFPLPRQYATSSALFVAIFILLLPFGLMTPFDKMGGFLIWLTVPFTALIAWVYWLMELIGDYAENPFEGLALDIPMASLCRTIEIDLKEMLEESELPAPIQPVGDILM